MHRKNADIILNLIPSGLFTVDKDKRITSWNRRAGEITGYSEEEVMGNPCYVFAETPCKEKCGLYSDDKAKSLFSKECVIITKGGETRYISKNAELLKDENGAVIGGIESFEDITERKKKEIEIEKIKSEIEAKLKEEERGKKVMLSLMEDIAETRDRLKLLTQDLERSNVDLEQFAYVASHDLQEPLRVITGYLDMLKEANLMRLDEESTGYIDTCIGAAKHMQNLIQGLLEYSRVTSQSKPFASVNLEDVFNKVTANLKISAEETNAVITRDTLPEISGDELQLNQLFQNLIGNAIKYRGNDNPRIEVSVKDEGGDWLFCIKDNGIGFPQEYSDQAFDLFRRLPGVCPAGKRGTARALALRFAKK